MNLVKCGTGSVEERYVPGSLEESARSPRWFALFTYHQHEQKVITQLRNSGIESFSPVYEEQRVWKNRQKKTLVLPLFPCYVFAHLRSDEYASAWALPSVHRIVGSSKGPIALPDQQIEFLRTEGVQSKIRPYKGLVLGQKVRITSGPMAGIAGVLMRQQNSTIFVVSVGLIN